MSRHENEPKMNVSIRNHAIMKRTITLVSAWLALNSVLLGANQDQPTVTKAVINYSVAPWDDAAYEILVPMPKVGEDSNPYVRIDIWGNPEYPKPTSLRFSKGSNRKEGGRATLQTVLNKSMPVDLTGVVSFRKLKKGHTVFGNFEFTAPDGKTFAASFEASWGNKPLPYIR
jgi:hypothetical protein